MKLIKSILLIIVVSLVTSCSNNMKPEDFKNTEPTLLIEEYFNGIAVRHAIRITLCKL